MGYFALAAFINTVTSLVLGSIVLLRNWRSSVYQRFALFAGAVAAWSFFYLLWQIATSPTDALHYIRWCIFFAVFIPILYFHFVLSFTKTNRVLQILLYSGYFLAILFALIAFTDHFIRSVHSIDFFDYWPVPGLLFHYFLGFWSCYVVLATGVLLDAFFHASHIKRYQILAILIGTTIGYVGGATNFFLWYDIAILPYGNILVSVYVLLVTYAIVKQKLFNIKVLVAEVLILALWLASLIRLALSDAARDLYINSGYFISVILLGIFLLYNVRRDHTQREEIEKLMGGLSRANKRLQRLDKQKSEFVSIASHQLRSPLTAMRGYASMLLEGSFGKIPAKSRKPLEHIAESARLMALSIEDYLSVSRIESGNMKYDYSDFTLPELAHHITDDLRPEAVRAGLLLLCKTDLDTDGIVHADKGKTQQILHNLINNSIKYTKKGSVMVYVHDDKKAKKIYVEVIDSGIGMNEETQHNIFQKFHRAKDANSINVHGTGLGLYVARKMATEMGGDVTGYSDGPGKGSHFILELPVKH